MKNDLCFENKIVTNASNFPKQWLRDAEFVSMKLVEERKLPLGWWGGEMGIAGMRVVNNFLGGVKQPIIQGGGFGKVNSGDEYDAAVDDLVQLCEATPSTFYQYCLFVAQKPQL